MIVLLSRAPACARRVDQIGVHAQVRKQATILEHVADFAGTRRNIDAILPIQHDTIIEHDASMLHIEQAGDGIEYRGLAGTGIAEKGETARTRRKRDIDGQLRKRVLQGNFNHDAGAPTTHHRERRQRRSR